MTIRELAPFIPFHHDFIDAYGDVEFCEDDWQLIDGSLILDLGKIKRKTTERSE